MRKTVKSKFVGACVSERGAVRPINQDSILFKLLKGKKGNIAIGVILDGVGGLERGELASGLLKTEFENWLDGLEKRMDISAIEADILYSHFKDELEVLNDTVRSFAFEQRISSGTTLSLIILAEKYFFTLNIGDSRVYLLRDELLSITDDDIVVKKKNGYYKKLLSNYMGRSDELIFSENCGQIRQGDVFLFCSDGFYHMLKSSDLLRLRDELIKPDDIEEELKQLVNTMIIRGEKDNISAGIIKVIGE